ncbi:MAG: pyruvate dehydrogenase complex dihydrolipoamide acetyltransferase [Verrucomicrobiota bacterium]
MPELIEMPKLSDTMTEGTLVKWLKKEGESVESGDVIAEIETDKATMDLEVFEDGTLLKILAKEGDAVPVSNVIAFVGEDGEEVTDEMIAKAAASSASESAQAEEDKKEEPSKKETVSTVSSPDVSAPAAKTSKPAFAGSSSRIKASPLARKLAKENGVMLEGLVGTGPGGRIVKKDVLSASASAGAGTNWGVFPAGPVAAAAEIPLTNMRKTIAKRLVQSKNEAPHFYVEMEIECADMIELRKQLNARFETLPKPFKLSFNDFVMKAAAQAVRKVPAINSSWEGDIIRQHSSVQLSFGVAIPDGLITPVIRDAQNKSVKEISLEARELIGKAKEGKLKPEEYTGGTITISNLGMFGVDSFSAIVNPPQAAILAVGNIVKKPVVNPMDEIVVGHRMNITISADHRVVDGAVAAQYLGEVKNLLETPALLLL